MRFFPGLLMIMFALSGCASLTEDECGEGDWLTIGKQDALKGLPKSRLNDHKKACERYNIAPDGKQYETGYASGLLLYCTAENGFKVGRNGYSYKKTCPADAEARFLTGFEKGKLLHEVESQIAEVKASLREIEFQIVEIQADSGKDREKELVRLEAETDRLERELGRLERQRDLNLISADRFLQSVSPDL